MRYKGGAGTGAKDWAEGVHGGFHEVTRPRARRYSGAWIYTFAYALHCI
jgi:hypothetical protein